MARKKKKTTRRDRRPAKKAAAKRTPIKAKKKAKRAPAPRKPSAADRAKRIRATVPNPVAAAFVVLSWNETATTESFLGAGDAFSTDPTTARLFADKAEAQTVIDEALVLADEFSPFHKASIEAAKKHLKPTYQFVLGDDQLLDVKVVPADGEAVTFAQAHKETKRILSGVVKAAQTALARFEKTWG